MFTHVSILAVFIAHGQNIVLTSQVLSFHTGSVHLLHLTFHCSCMNSKYLPDDEILEDSLFLSRSRLSGLECGLLSESGNSVFDVQVLWNGRAPLKKWFVDNYH